MRNYSEMRGEVVCAAEPNQYRETEMDGSIVRGTPYKLGDTKSGVRSH